MSQPKIVKLPSGASLRIMVSPFPQAKALYQAILKELKLLEFNSKSELAALYKDLFCVGFSSPEVEAALWECFKRCTYNSGKGEFRLDENTFEPEEARDDYMMVCMEVAKANVLPFVKSLYAEYQRIIAMTESTPA